MLKRRILAFLSAILLVFIMSDFAVAVDNDMNTDAEPSPGDVVIEPISNEDLPFDVNEVSDSTEEENYIIPAEKMLAETYIPLDLIPSETSIAIDIDNSVYQKDALKVEVFILDESDNILHYDSSIDAEKLSAIKSTPSIQLAERMQEGETYSISMMITYDTYIESYDGSFTIIDGQPVFGYIFQSSADIADLNAEDEIVLRSSSRNEAEPNNTYGQANPYTDDDNMYSKISTISDHDWYRVKFAVDGKANFFLGYIPSNCNYNLTVYYATSQYSSPNVIFRGVKPSNMNELLENVTINPNWYYYMEVYSASGFNTTSMYQVRAKNYPIADGYEPNDSRQTAKSVSSNTTINATIHKASDDDWYRFYASTGLFTASLSNIPYGTNYQLELYNSSGTAIGTSSNTGTQNEQITANLSAGTYYVRVYSASGYSIASKYKLVLFQYSSSFTLNITLAPEMPDRYGGTASNRNLKNVPYTLYAVNDSNAERQVSTGQTNSSGNIYTTATLPSGYTKWRIEFKLDNSDLKCSTNAGTVYEFTYDLDLPTGTNTIRETLPEEPLTDEEDIAYGMWYTGYQGRDLYASKVGSPGKLDLRGTLNANQGTETNGSRIWFNTAKNSQDYLDLMVLCHELGHWFMYDQSAMPLLAGGTHNWTSPSTNATAWSEGWAQYFSTALTGNNYVLDYGQTTFGGRLSDRSYYQGTSATPSFTVRALRTDYYSNNQKIELFTSHVLYNLTSEGYKSFSQLRDLISPRKNSMQDLYDEVMSNASASQKVGLWQTFEMGGCAYDTELPTVRLVTNGSTSVTADATDDVGIAKYEWYVNGNLVPGNNTKTLSLTSYSGTLSIEVRVFDYEGVATGVRSRTARSASAQTSVVRSLSKANKDLLENGDLEVDSDAEIKAEDSISISLDEIAKYKIYADENEDIYVYAHASGVVGGYKIYDPSGILAYNVDYISPDTPYIIENAAPGEWVVEVCGLTSAEMRSMIKENLDALISEDGGKFNTEYHDSTDASELKETSETTIDRIYEDFAASGAVNVSIALAVRPSKVNVENYTWTADPNILCEMFSHEEGAVVTENGKNIDINEPLSDGLHELTVMRQSHGRSSESVFMDVRVNRAPPTITFDYEDIDIKHGDERNTYITAEDKFFVSGKVSEGVVEIYLDGEPAQTYDGYLFIMGDLDFGSNVYEITLIDGVGNKTVDYVTIDRTGN